MNLSSLSAAEAADLWKDYRPTTLLELPLLAQVTSVGRVFVKAEGERPFGNFKVLGGMVAGLRALARAAGVPGPGKLSVLGAHGRLRARLLCASDGNHGLAVAAAAARAGACSSIYMPVGVQRVRADRIEACGGNIVWISGTYDDAVLEAAAAAGRGEGILVPDTASEPDDAAVLEVMGGYSLLTQEVADQFRAIDGGAVRPSHLMIQAGVGGLAAALASGLSDMLVDPKKLLVVEPERANCVGRALAAGRPVRIAGDLRTSADMLSCGVASATALRILQRHNTAAVEVGEELLNAAVTALRESGGPAATPSGAAGVAGLLKIASHPELRSQHRVDSSSVVLLVATEGIP